MIIDIHFETLKNISSMEKGLALIEIFKSNGLFIEKVNGFEPVKHEFVESEFEKWWNPVGKNGKTSSCYFLFKGKKEVSFSGQIIWFTKLLPGSKAVQGVNVYFTLKKNFDFNKLTKLGDELFIWSESVYGLISETSLYPQFSDGVLIGNIYDGISGMYWVNYFGKEYISCDDFRSENHVVLEGGGARLIQAERPDDEKLADQEFLLQEKRKIGIEWFWSKPYNRNLKLPKLDRTEITRKDC